MDEGWRGERPLVGACTDLHTGSSTVNLR
jgi:hypothetical protein